MLRRRIGRTTGQSSKEINHTKNIYPLKQTELNNKLPTIYISKSCSQILTCEPRHLPIEKQYKKYSADRHSQTINNST